MELIIPGYSLAGALAAIAILAIIGIALRKRRKDPWYRFNRILRRIAREVDRNLMIPDGMGGQIQLDYLLLTSKGILVLDMRNAPGIVFGGDRMDEWAVLGPAGRYGMKNPQEALFDRLAAVRALAEGVPISGFVVFADSSEFTKGTPSNVLTVSQLEEKFAPCSTNADDKLHDAFLPYWRKIHSALRAAKSPPAA